MSPVILLGLVLMWAVVLVPMWLRRHDEVEETRSVDRFTTAMHTLSRYDEKQRDEVRSHRSRALDVHVSGASAPDAIAARRRHGMAQRRARSLAVLLVSSLAVLVGAIVSGSALVWVLQALLDVAWVSFVVHLRHMAALAASARRRASRRERVRRELDEALTEPASSVPQRTAASWEEGVTVHRTTPAADPVRVTSAVREDSASAVFDQTALDDHDVVEPGYAAAVEPMSARVASDGFFDQESDLSVSVAAEPSFIEAGPRRASQVAAEPEELPAEPAAQTVGVGSPWEPVPVPRPTYSMKPAAPPRPTRRRISEPLLPPVETVAEIEGDDDLEAILDRRWAVND